MLEMLGPLLSAGSSLVGGLLGKSSADAARESAERMRQQDIELQKQFAQNGIQWKVADAKAAGVHPLYALGASTTSYAPTAFSTSPDNSMGSAVKSMGQDLSRAVHATSSESERTRAYTASLQSLDLDNKSLQNDLLRSQIARLNQQNNPAPATPNTRWLIDGQGSTATSGGAAGVGSASGGLINDQAMKRTLSDPAAPFREPGAIPGLGYERTQTGWAPVPSENVKERIEDSPMEKVWFMKNNVLPTFQSNLAPPYKAPEGKFWYYSPMLQEYQLHDVKEWHDKSHGKFNRYMDYITGRR